MEPIQPIGRPSDGPVPVPAIRRLTPKEREEAAQERRKRRRAREQAAQERRKRRRAREQAARRPGGDEPPEGSVSLDVRA
jgi:hypothetical protein